MNALQQIIYHPKFAADIKHIYILNCRIIVAVIGIDTIFTVDVPTSIAWL
jgi:hypothetical protein